MDLTMRDLDPMSFDLARIKSKARASTQACGEKAAPADWLNA